MLEAVNLLNARAGNAAALRFMEQSRASKLLTLHHISAGEHAQAQSYFKKMRIKNGA